MANVLPDTPRKTKESLVGAKAQQITIRENPVPTKRISFIFFFPFLTRQGQIYDRRELSCHLKDFFFHPYTLKIPIYYPFIPYQPAVLTTQKVMLKR